MVREMTFEEEAKYLYKTTFTSVQSSTQTTKYEPHKEVGMRITVKNSVKTE